MKRAQLWIAVSLVTFVAGCGGLSQHDRDALAGAEQTLQEDPQSTLRTIEPILDSNPDLVLGLVLRARAYDRLERFDAARESWRQVIDARGSKSSEELLEAHERFGQLMRDALGPLPHRYTSEPDAEEGSRIEAALESFEFLADHDETRSDAWAGMGECEYRLGRLDDARRSVERALAASQNDGRASYLGALLDEQEEGPTEAVLSRFFRLARTQEGRVQVEVFRHLSFLLQQGKLDKSAEDNLRGTLVRVSRDANANPELREWAQEFERTERERLDSRRFVIQFEEIERAVANGEFRKAWSILESMPLNHPAVQQRRSNVNRAWTRTLLERGRDRLDNGDLPAAQGIASQLEKLPGNQLPDDLRGQRADFLASLESVQNARSVKRQLKRARDAMRRRQPSEALAHLEGLTELARGDEREQVLLLRARALVDADDRLGALDAYDQIKEVREIADRRNYGLLLVEAGRAEEASQYLELMPIGAMQGDVLDALLASLERQGNWEKILARLSDLRPLPQRYRDLRRTASLEAAERWLRLGSADRSLRVLRSYLDEDELSHPRVIRTYLQSLLRGGELSTARSVLLDAPANVQASLPQNLVLEWLDRCGDTISEETRYDLLKRTSGGSSDAQVEERIAKMAPRFGSYLPSPGSYGLLYRTTHFTPRGTEEFRREHEGSLEWDGSQFLFDVEELPKEQWYAEGGVWYRVLPGGEMLIPVRVRDKSLPKESYTLNGTLWTSEVTEIGNDIVAGNVTYKGCIRVRLIPNEEEKNAIYLDIAPQVGEVKRETYERGSLARSRELMRFWKQN